MHRRINIHKDKHSEIWKFYWIISNLNTNTWTRLLCLNMQKMLTLPRLFFVYYLRRRSTAQLQTVGHFEAMFWTWSRRKERILLTADSLHGNTAQCFRNVLFDCFFSGFGQVRWTPRHVIVLSGCYHLVSDLKTKAASSLKQCFSRLLVSEHLRLPWRLHCLFAKSLEIVHKWRDANWAGWKLTTAQWHPIHIFQQNK